MKKKERIPNELISLNLAPFTEFSVEELEQRLETDPLMLNHLFGFVDDSARKCDCKKACDCNEVCDGDSCSCDGTVRKRR